MKILYSDLSVRLARTLVLPGVALVTFATCNSAFAAAPLVALPFEKDVGVSSARPDPVGAGVIEIAAPRPRGRVVVKAADFGFSETNDNNVVAINAALAEAKRIGASRVELAPGTYRCFHGDNCKVGQTYFGRNSNIIIEDFTDFTFDGKGAELVFRRPPRYPIKMQRSDGKKSPLPPAYSAQKAAKWRRGGREAFPRCFRIWV